MSAVVAVRTTKVVPLPLLPHRTHLLSRDMEVQKEVHMIVMLPCTLMGKFAMPNQSTSTPKVNSLQVRPKYVSASLSAARSGSGHDRCFDSRL